MPAAMKLDMPTWDAPQYLKFADQRTRPAAELLARVPEPASAVRHMVDLGCGPGNSTALLVERWPTATVVGVDSSAQMLERARTALPKVTWVQADVRDYRAETPPDVIFANAVLHWLPDHGQLVPALFEQLAAGGALAFQVPYNFQEPSHRLMRELSRGRLQTGGADPGARWVVEPAVYYDWLAPHASSVDIWQTRYEQVMPNASAIVEWVRGTGLRPYLEAMPDELHPAFLEGYERAIADAYPPRSDGQRLFSFPRLFIVAVK